MNITLAAVERALAQGRWSELEAALARDKAVGRWLARAIRRDLSVVVAHQELIFPCAYRHLRRHGGDEGSPPIRALLRDWQQEMSKRRGGRWLCALREMPVPLDAPLLEEVRGGTALGGPDWPALEEPRFSLDWSKRKYGVFAWRDRISGAANEMIIDDDTSFDVIADAPGGDVLIAGWWGDYDGVLCRVNPSTRRLVWRMNLEHAIGGIAVSPDGRLAVIRDGRRCFAVDVQTGREPGRLDLVPSAPCRFSADGRLIAVEAHGVVQLWDLTGLLATRWPEPTGTYGLVDAEFSPDGARLLSGQRLCDGRTGKLIAMLDVEQGNYLEGGPPRRGRRMVRDGFVEASPLGMQKWDAQGRLVVDDKQRHFSLRHEVVFASDGEIFALGPPHFSEGPIELRGVRDDRLFAVIEAKCTSVFEWSPDDAHLAFVTRNDELCLANRDGSFRIIGQAPQTVELRFSIDGASIQSRHEGGALRFWSTVRGGSMEGDGFRDRAHPYLGRFEHGLFEITDERTNEVVARIPSDEPLVSDPTGLFWAGRRSHLELAPT